MTDRTRGNASKTGLRTLHRELRPQRPGDGRTVSECALAARMLLKLQTGKDVRARKVAVALDLMDAGLLNNDRRLDLALDRMIDQIEEDTGN